MGRGRSSAGEAREARRLLEVIRPLEDARARPGDTYNISLVKFWHKHCGHAYGPPQPPHRLSDAEKSEFAKLLVPIRAEEAGFRRS